MEILKNSQIPKNNKKWTSIPLSNIVQIHLVEFLSTR